MNRYVIEGMLRDAQRGKRIICVDATYGCSTITAEKATRIAGPDATIHRMNGVTTITYPNNGTVRILSPVMPGALRGLTADVIIIDTELEHKPDTHSAIQPIITHGAELIRA